MPLKLDCLIEKDENGVYCAEVPSLPGCFTDGRTLSELKTNLAEAVELYLEDLVAEKAESDARGNGSESLRTFSFSVVPSALSAPKPRRVRSLAR
ncbi:MAG: type II toxin-antitoxin system HicB family antitoxin [Kiritimatiellae bacterium]|nr:type II toxin-antitoxin system HicB family antitoxin [Kiritimatiellia bacterium]